MNHVPAKWTSRLHWLAGQLVHTCERDMSDFWVLHNHLTKLVPAYSHVSRSQQNPALVRLQSTCMQSDELGATGLHSNEHILSRTCQNVYDTRRKCLLRTLSEHDCGERRVRARLDDAGVACDRRR